MEQGAQSRVVEILLVEDNAGDVRLTVEALRESTVNHRLHIVNNGLEAMDFLHRKNPYEGAPRPALILLDLNLPKKDGRETLAEIKTHMLLKQIPVLVLSTSKADEDIRRSYDLHANCYIVKPVLFDEFVRTMRGIEAFWLTMVKLPTC
jgi:two-component system, chemotaxis family, response regulator Rcp1